MLFARLAGTSRDVASVSGRLRKIDLIAQLLRQLGPDEVETAVAFLSGALASLGIGYAVIRDSAAPPAAEPSLQILDVRNALEAAGEVTRYTPLAESGAETSSTSPLTQAVTAGPVPR